MDDKKRGEILAFFWFVVSVLTLLSLASYTPLDIAFEVSSPNNPTRNFVGIAGATSAWALFLIFGKIAYVLVPLFLFWAVAKWTGVRSQRAWLKLFSTVIFLSSACAAATLLVDADSTVRFRAGGVLGFFTAGFLSDVFGHAALFVSLSLLILSILLATELLLLQIGVDLFKRARHSTLTHLAQKMQGPADKPVSKPDPAKARPQAPVVRMPAKEEPAREAPRDSVKEAPKPAPKPAPPAEEKLQIKLSTPPAEPPKTAAPKEAESKPVLVETPQGPYSLPPIDLLLQPPPVDRERLKDNLEESSKVLEDTLRDFGIDAKVVEVEQGPTITRYELQPAAGVKVQRITALENDIALAMRATSVRIIAPIPGKSRVGIEVPNSASATVYLREVLTSPEFQKETSKIAVAIGKDTAGAPIVCNLADMPHLLIAGATNTGKSVCINSLVVSLLYKASPEEVKLLMVDPKMVELHFYNDLPHLICPVVTDKSKVPGALGWLVSEMEKRYKLLSRLGARNILAYNEKVQNNSFDPELLLDEATGQPIQPKKMPFIVVIIDELADLMIASAQEVEGAITRLAQLARAVGIHMVLATQRPSVDVITGVIKANFPARIAFQVASKVDSRTILDENGADKLLGRGDLLLMDPRKSKLTRAQGAWVQDAEIEKITDFIRRQRRAAFNEEILQSQQKKQILGDFKHDEVYDQAKQMVLETGIASVSMIQRRLGLGYTRSARLMDMMEEEGVVGPYRGSKPREILVDRPKGAATAEAGESEEENP